MIRRVLVIATCLVLAIVCMATAEPDGHTVQLTPDNSGVKLFVSIDGRILEITVPDGETADPDDPDDPIGTGWVEVFDAAASMTGDLIFSPDGNLNFSLPSEGQIGRTTLDGSLSDFAPCGELNCQPSGLAINYHGDLLAVDKSNTGGLLRWSQLVGLDFNGIDPTVLKYPIGVSTTPSGVRVPGSDAVGRDWVALQEWYTGELASIQATSSSRGAAKKGGGGGGAATLHKSRDSSYDLHSKIGGVDKDALDLAITQARIFYTTGSDVFGVDVDTGASFECATIPGRGEARYISGDVGGLLYVAAVDKKKITVHQIDYSAETGECGSPQLLKTFLTKDFGDNLGGLASTYSTLSSELAIAGDDIDTIYRSTPDGMHYYNFRAVCPTPVSPATEHTCEISTSPALLTTAVNAIESSEDPFNPEEENPSRGLPFNLPGQGFPWEYNTDGFAGFNDPYIGEAEFHEFFTNVSGTNFRLACCPQTCAGEVCDYPDCEFGALMYALPIPSEIVADPRGTKRGTGSVCYESLTSTRNAGLYAADFCGWNSPLVPTPMDLDVDAFFCGPTGVTSVSQGSNVPVKFNVGLDGLQCETNEAPPYDLTVLFSAGVVGYCTGETFTALPDVEPVLDIMPSGEGYLNPETGQILFAKAGPKKQYQFNLDTGQIPLSHGAVRTIVQINATFLEDSIEDGDQSVFIALEP